MKRSIVYALVVCATAGVASAQDGAGSGSAGTAIPDKADKGTATGEKAGNNETLQNGEGERPWAAGVPAAEQQAALALFHEGNVRLNDGLFAKAVERYREALKHWQHPAVDYNLALALMNLDQPIEAYESMQRAIRFGDAPLQSKDKFDHAKEYILLLAKQLADVEVSCDKVGARVQVDGKDVFVAPGRYAGRVRIGKHTFVAEKSGYATRIRAPFIGPGEKFRIELKLYTADELTRYSRRWDRWVPYAVLGGGVALAGVGGLLELLASNNYRSYDDKIAACNQNNQGCQASPALVDQKKRGDSERTMGFVGYGVAGATLAVGATLLYLNRERPYQIRAEDLTNERDDLAVQPVVTPTFAGAQVHGHF